MEFVEGWGIPKPDAIFELPQAFAVPASGKIEYQYVIEPTGFTEDKWVQKVEVRPTARDLEPDRTEAIRATCWLSAGDAVFFVAGKARFAGSLRNAAGRGVETRPAPAPPDHRLPDVRAPRGDRSGRFGGMLDSFHYRGPPHAAPRRGSTGS